MGFRSYTFYSNPHNSYARLDYIFCTPTVLTNSAKADLHVCPWSDHHMVAFSTSRIGLKPTTYTWRRNDSPLTGPAIIDSLTTHLGNYFTENLLPETSPCSLWTAHKAVMQGQLINIAVSKHKAKYCVLYQNIR